MGLNGLSVRADGNWTEEGARARRSQAGREEREPMSPAPRRRRCGAMQVHERLLETYPSFRRNEARIDQFTERSIALGTGAARDPPGHHDPGRRPRGPQATSREHLQGADQEPDQRPELATSGPATLITPSVPPVWQGLVAEPEDQVRPGNARIRRARRPTASRGPRPRRRFVQRRRRREVRAPRAAPTRGPAERYLNLWVCNLGGRPARLRAVPGRPGAHRRRGDPQQRVRHHGRRRGPLQPRAHAPPTRSATG